MFNIEKNKNIYLITYIYIYNQYVVCENKNKTSHIYFSSESEKSNYYCFANDDDDDDDEDDDM